MHRVQNWYCSREALSGEPVITLQTLDGRVLTFMLPSVTAEELGWALVEQGREAAPEPLLN